MILATPKLSFSKIILLTLLNLQLGHFTLSGSTNKKKLEAKKAIATITMTKLVTKVRYSIPNN